MLNYYIYKSTRSSERSYGGSTCKKAGVTPNKIYTSYEEAKKDCEKMNKHNPVGFRIKEFKPISLNKIKFEVLDLGRNFTSLHKTWDKLTDGDNLSYLYTNLLKLEEIIRDFEANYNKKYESK